MIIVFLRASLTRGTHGYCLSKGLVGALVVIFRDEEVAVDVS